MNTLPLLLFFVPGLLVGSFLNVCIHRLPRGRSVVSPPSSCPSCGARVRPYDNIPVLSWVLLRGRCRDCGKRISIRYPLVELATGAAFLLVGSRLPRDAAILFPLFYASALIVVTFTDLDLQIIPDSITLPGIPLGIVYLGAIRGAWRDSLLGVLAGGGSLWLLGEGYYRLRKREGMGGGDVKLAALMGAFLGWKMILPVLFVSSLLGGLFGIGLIAARRGEGSTPIPFGVFLAPVGFLALLYGDAALAWYLSLATG